MRKELQPIWDAITEARLPATSDELFSLIWDASDESFNVQETYILDFKDRAPEKFSDGYGSSIIRLALGYYNSFGGIVIFGVKDRSLDVLGIANPIDIENFNRVLTDVSGLRVECVSKEYDLAPGKSVSVLLVPRRGMRKPVRLAKPIGPYVAGKLWVRDRHEVLEADTTHLPTLFSSRDNLPSDAILDSNTTIFRSLPPSPATMHTFVGRESLLATLWEWFVFGDQPRIYLHGPGGSGKSTLAFEFARVLAESGEGVTLSNGERIDYVLYISGKEDELNPIIGKQQEFVLRQFDNSKTQFIQILVASGQYSVEELQDFEEDGLLTKITDLFNSYNGLIVIDDIDALSRVGEDTGEEPLLLQAIRGAKTTRILYTLRSAPNHALRSAMQVPGLAAGDEFNEFLVSCCDQFEVPVPDDGQFGRIARETSSLPLLVETIVGLRRVTGSFKEAIAQFKERGDDDARRYLYQREYDRLAKDGKSREVLAALSNLKEPVAFTTLANLLGIPARMVTDAISECGSIFLTTVDNRQGETLYQLALPSKPFIKNVSERLNRADQIKRRVELFLQQGAYTAKESALIVQMDRMAREGRMSDIVTLYQSHSPEDPVLANPKVLALAGQAYSWMGPNSREQARECFRAAEAMNYRDIFMMRCWYAMETASGYGITEGIRLCRAMIDGAGVSPRYKSEFWSKLGRSYFQEAQSLMSVSREKGFDLLRQSIDAYLEALWVGRHSREILPQENLGWLERPLHTMLVHSGEHLDEYMDVIGRLPDRKHDVSMDGAILLLQMLSRIRTPADSRTRTKMAGLCQRASSRLDKFVRDSDSFPGLSYLIEQLGQLQTALRSPHIA